MITAVKNKWASTIKRLEVLPRDKFIGDDGTVYYKASGTVKANLRVAVFYLKCLDDREEPYQVPFDRKKFEQLLSEPVGKKKIEEAVRIKHECAKMARRNTYDV
nr:hypothetical protein CJ225_05995 [Gardnerella vaginalis]